MPTTSLPNPNDHFISLQTAVDMTSLYQTNRETILAKPYQNRDILAINETFHRDAIDTLLATPDCKGIRIYPGMDEDERVHFILVAVDKDNEDILPSATNEVPVIVEVAQRCPPTCPPASVLNP
jgi:hypothetical protein